ncbi:MAG: hypothetical protein AAF628_22455 [Planctomycetota bacterium]
MNTLFPSSPAAILLALATLSTLSAAPRTQPPARPVGSRVLLASDGLATDRAGTAVALHDRVAIIGAPFSNPAGIADAGSAYLWTRGLDGMWRETSALTASDARPGDQLGAAVAVDANRTLVAAPFDDTPPRADTGAVYVFEPDAGGAWLEVAKLQAGDQGIADRFGLAVALDGDRVLVGSPFDDTDGAPDAGSAYVFERDPGGAWIQVAKLQAIDPVGNDQFGDAVALSGDRAMIGAHLKDTAGGSDAGLVYVFERDAGGVWRQVSTIVPTDGMPADLFGSSVALAGDRAVISAPLDDTSRGSNAGSAYVFERDGTGFWREDRKLEANDGAGTDQFGVAVALSGERVLIGAHFHGALTVAGAAYVFERDSRGSWWQLAKIVQDEPRAFDEFGSAVALDGDDAFIGAPSANQLAVDAGAATVATLRGVTLRASDAATNDQLGSAAAIRGNHALLGAPGVAVAGKARAGAAYVWERDGSGAWLETAKLNAMDTGIGDEFGRAVATDGGLALVGSPLDDVDEGADAGSAYVFVRDTSGTWSQQRKLQPSVPAEGDEFGRAVALLGTRALVGAPRDDHGRGQDAGSAYVFERDGGGTWHQVAQLIADDGMANDTFGTAVALAGDRALVGAPSHGSADRGAVYVFERNGTGAWLQVAKLTASDGAARDQFGSALAMSGNLAAIGAPFAGPDGAVYLFEQLSAGLWTELQKLEDATAGYAWGFGRAVALVGDRLLVGEPFDSTTGFNAGSAFLYTRGAGGTWQQQQLLAGTDTSAFDMFGSAVALSTDSLLVTAPLKGAPGAGSSGATYIAPLPPLATCVVRNGTGINPIDFACISTPVLGQDWDTSIATTPATSLTAIGLAALPAQFPLPGTSGELLLGLAPPPTFLVGLGTHSLTIPRNASLVGARLYSQGFRIDAPGGTATLVPLNALDVVLGV